MFFNTANRNFCWVILKSVWHQRNKRDVPHWGGFIGRVCFVPVLLGCDAATWGTRGLCSHQGTAGLRVGTCELPKAPVAGKLSWVSAVPYLMRHLKGLSCKRRWSSMHVGDHSWKPTQISVTRTFPPQPRPSALRRAPSSRAVGSRLCGRQRLMVLRSPNGIRNCLPTSSPGWPGRQRSQVRGGAGSWDCRPWHEALRQARRQTLPSACVHSLAPTLSQPMLGIALLEWC